GAVDDHFLIGLQPRQIAAFLHIYNCDRQTGKQRFKRIADAHPSGTVAQRHAAVFADLNDLRGGQILKLGLGIIFIKSFNLIIVLPF
ncbi:MAG: hypothetical protein IIW90_08725, partial [Alistipes sp.]|nr:hypothetical protein [Alistipes sp.]